MSGGSYEYLCFKSADELFNAEHSMQSMFERLVGLGYAEDAARETEELILIMRQFRIRAEVRLKRLSSVWQSVEWWDSGDSGEEGVKESLARYRGENER